MNQSPPPKGNTGSLPDPNRSDREDREDPRGKPAAPPDQRKHPDDIDAQKRAARQNAVGREAQNDRKAETLDAPQRTEQQESREASTGNTDR